MLACIKCMQARWEAVSRSHQGGSTALQQGVTTVYDLRSAACALLSEENNTWKIDIFSICQKQPYQDGDSVWG